MNDIVIRKKYPMRGGGCDAPGAEGLYENLGARLRSTGNGSRRLRAACGIIDDERNMEL